MSKIQAVHIGGMYKNRRGVVMHLDANGIVFNPDRKTAEHFTWEQVDRFSVEDPKRTKMNLGAVAMFGVLGLGARTNYSLLYFASGDRTALFEVPGMPVQWRSWVDAFTAEIPASRGKLFIAGDGPPPAAGDETASIPAAIAALADLRDRGVLTDDEFSTKKAELLSRM